MYHYLFTNDFRISKLDESLKYASECIINDKVPSSSEDKSVNNNITTLSFYFNLSKESNCSKIASNGDIRTVVLNFIKKFQFPNMRTPEFFNQCLEDGIILAPMREIVKILYTMKLVDKTQAYLTKEEVKYFIFYNSQVAKKKNPNIVELINSIFTYRQNGIYPDSVDRNDSNHIWNQEERQIREMLKVLIWAGCVKEIDGKILIDNDDLSKENKADIFDIVNCDVYWEGNTLESYKTYMDIEMNTLSRNNMDIDDVLSHKLYGMHIKNKNNCLSEDNPHICIGWSEMGNLTTIESKESLGAVYDQSYDDRSVYAKGQDVGQIWRFIKEMQIGDYVVFAESDIFHIGKVISNYYYEENINEVEQDIDYKNNRSVEWIKKNISRKDISKTLHNSLKTAMSIWTMNDYRAAIGDLINGVYVKDEIDEEILEDIDNNILKSCLEIEREERKIKIHPLNSIVYGAPGTGKTYSMAEYAQAIIGNISREEFCEKNKDRKKVMDDYHDLVRKGQIVFTTFHQSYGYEEFIQGLRPDSESETMRFKTVDGIFKRIADKALNDEENNYVIIIDEINRANISKVFGELITLIEDDKRWGEINQTNATLQSGDIFAVPNNLYIIGTMNSADKSISLIDTALRRRFEFIEQKPEPDKVNDPTMKAILVELNKILVDKLDSADLLIGHSYFMNKTIDDLPKVLNNSIIPLLYEYFYDEKNKVKQTLKDSMNNDKVNVKDYVICDDKLGRLYVIEGHDK